ncbi:MAG: phage baseplate assembly protein V [Salinisphaeraceae bacterium]
MREAAELHRLLHNLIRVGTIAEVDHAAARARLRDGDLLTDWRPWVELRTGTTRDWDPPTVGEQAVLFSPGGDPAAAFILTGLFSSAHAAPADDPAVCRRVYPDNAIIEYNHETHHLQATIPGTATLEADSHVTVSAGGSINATSGASIVAEAAASIEMTSPDNRINGPLHVTENITTPADVVAGQISLKLHKTSGVKAGPDLSSVPVP